VHKSSEVVEKNNNHPKIIIEKLKVFQLSIILNGISVLKNDKIAKTIIEERRQMSNFFSPLNFAIEDNFLGLFLMRLI
jgi:type II secretory pathway component PulC